MANNVDEIRRYIARTFPNWVKKDVAIKLAKNDLKAWNEGDDSDKFSIGDLIGRIARYELKKFVIDNIDQSPNMTQLAHATGLAVPQFLYAVGVQNENTNSGVSFPDYANSLAQLITIGWRDQAELHARLGLQELMKHSTVRGTFKGGALDQGQTLFGFPYGLMDVMKDWLRADKVSTDTPWRDELYEDYGGYRGWEELVENWREPSPTRFASILSRAADFHVAQSRDMETSGRDDDDDFVEHHFEVEQDQYWLYPVILLTFLRLREWEGLPNPGILDHDIFQHGIFKHLPKVPNWEPDEFFQTVDRRFRGLFPQTPSAANLPALRAAQT